MTTEVGMHRLHCTDGPLAGPSTRSGPAALVLYCAMR